MFGTGHFSLIPRLVLLDHVPGSRQGDDQWKQNTNAQLFGTRKIFKHKEEKNWSRPWTDFFFLKYAALD
jgi:hypothetical protein